jgi:hypothetical protein
MSVNTDQKIIQNKVGLRKLADMLGSVSQACNLMGYSRDSFCRFQVRALEGAREEKVARTASLAQLLFSDNPPSDIADMAAQVV